MANKRAVCITKKPTHDDTHHHITHVGVGDNSGYNDYLPVETVIANLKSPNGDRYYIIGTDGSQAWVIVKQCPRCKHFHEIISTTADNTKKDNLLSLPECRT